MDPLIDRLRTQRDGLDLLDVTPPPAALATVVKRGRRYAAVTAAMSLLGASGALAVVALAAPLVVERFERSDTPVVLDAPEGADGPATTADRNADDPLVPLEGDVLPAPRVEDVEPDDTVPELTVDEERAASEAVIDSVAPDLAVTSPADGAVVTKSTVTFTGEVEPGATVTVGRYAADVAADGRWSLVLIASAGSNTVPFVATDAAGNATRVVHTVVYDRVEPPSKDGEVQTAGPKDTDTASDGAEPKDTRDETAVPAFTANQQHRELAGAPYTNSYWGTTAPGTKVKVWSDHGWNHTYADDAGAWELTVRFEPPPGTTTFPVTARHYDDGSVFRTFEVTTVAPEAAAFTAEQHRASVPASAPVNTYSGTGEPGHEVWIWTESHGETWTTIGGDGTWSVSIEFSAVTAGDRFDVKARDLTGGSFQYFEVAITAT